VLRAGIRTPLVGATGAIDEPLIEGRPWSDPSRKPGTQEAIMNIRRLRERLSMITAGALLAAGLMPSSAAAVTEQVLYSFCSQASCADRVAPVQRADDGCGGQPLWDDARGRGSWRWSGIPADAEPDENRLDRNRPVQLLPANQLR
jgi:hypothetical protein